MSSEPRSIFTGVCGQWPRIGWHAASGPFSGCNLLLDSEELLGFSRSGQRGRGRQASADDLLHLIEISGANEALMLDSFVPILGFAAEFFFLQPGIGSHPREFVAAGQFEHAQVQGMESGQRHELELVSHLRQFGLKAGNGGFVQVLPPVEDWRAVVGQHLVRILRPDCLVRIAWLRPCRDAKSRTRSGRHKERRRDRERSPTRCRRECGKILPACARRCRRSRSRCRYRWSEDWRCRRRCEP